MSEFIYANIQRAGATAPYVTGVFIQLSKMDAKEASDYQGADPHFTFRMYTKSLPVQDVTLVQQRDLVIDQRVIDPVTHAPRQFRIISDPNPKTLMMSWHWVAVHERGT